MTGHMQSAESGLGGGGVVASGEGLVPGALVRWPSAPGSPLGVITNIDGDRVHVRFAEPQRGIAPGQLVAFYLGDEVLGGGTIARATR